MMDSARFRYNRQDQGGGEDEKESRGELDQELELEVPCFLDIYVHHARNIHNICIYANQDVYAKFALTSAPDHALALSTRVAAGGGASPSFDERLPPLRIRRGRLGVDVLRCEVWMRSCAKTLLEDQLLGFALVPLAAGAAADGARLAQDFELSSTDLFHSPAGTIRLSLALHSGLPGDACPRPDRNAEPSITSEVVIIEPTPPVDYARIKFPNFNVVKENHNMAVQYLPFLQLGEARPPELDAMEMSTSPRGDGEKPASSSDDGSKNASTTTTASDDRVMASPSAKAIETPVPNVHESTAPMSCRCAGNADIQQREGWQGEGGCVHVAAGGHRHGRGAEPDAAADHGDIRTEHAAIQRVAGQDEDAHRARRRRRDRRPEREDALERGEATAAAGEE